MQQENAIHPPNEQHYEVPITVETKTRTRRGKAQSEAKSASVPEDNQQLIESDQFSSDAQQTPADTPAEYDTSGKQSIPSLLATGDGLAPVTLIYEPYAGGKPFDVHLKTYVRKLADVRETESDEEAFLARTEARLTAACELFDTVITDLTGLGEEGEEKPENWREFIGAEEKQNAVDSAILYARILDDQKVSAKVSWKSLGGSVTRLQCLVNGREVETRHTLKKADAKIVNEFLTTIAKAQSGERFDSLMFELAALYNRLKIGVKGYKDGVVPSHHKPIVLNAHINRQLTTIRKN